MPQDPNPLAGMALDYLLGADGPQRGKAGRITETPFGEGPAALGRSIAYCNLRREDGEPPEFGPYLPHDDIFAQFGEGRPDPKGQGFLRNIVEQLDHCRGLGHTLVEEDNPDSYPPAAVMRGVELAQQRGLGVIAKNPGLLGDAAPKYAGHPNVFGIIVEEDCGTPAEMDQLRRMVGKSDLPVWFVSFGDGRDFAERTAQAIKSARVVNMGVTYSREGEYETSEDVLRPLVAPALDLPFRPPRPDLSPMVSNEEPMADDFAKPGQGIDIVKVLLPLLLQSMLTGKQIDIRELLSALLTGKLLTLAPTPAPPPQLSSQQPTDLNALLLPLLYQVLTGKPLPGLAPTESEKTADKPTTTTTPAIQKPSVQLSVAGFGLSSILQALGTVGTPFSMGTEPTSAGTLTTLVPILTGAFGAAGGFGSLLSFARSLFSGLAGKAK
jgi:hypothetical protein